MCVDVAVNASITVWRIAVDVTFSIVAVNVTSVSSTDCSRQMSLVASLEIYRLRTQRSIRLGPSSRINQNCLQGLRTSMTSEESTIVCLSSQLEGRPIDYCSDHHPCHGSARLLLEIRFIFLLSTPAEKVSEQRKACLVFAFDAVFSLGVDQAKNSAMNMKPSSGTTISREGDGSSSARLFYFLIVSRHSE